MADYRFPNAVKSEEIDEHTVLVTLTCDAIDVGKHGGNSNAEVEVVIKETSFCVTAKVQKGKKTVNYRQEIKELPGEVDEENSTWKIEKGKVILELKKKEATSWKQKLMRSGLEQAPSDESD